MSDNQSASEGILTTPVIDQVIEFLNEESVRRQDEPGVEVINQWIEELPKLLVENANLKRDKERLSLRTGCVECKGLGFKKQHISGYTHYETDRGEECPAYHFESVPCGQCRPPAAMQGKSAALDSPPLNPGYLARAANRPLYADECPGCRQDPCVCSAPSEGLPTDTGESKGGRD